MGQRLRAAGSFTGGILLFLSLATVCSGQVQVVYSSFTSSGGYTLNNAWCVSGSTNIDCGAATRYVAAPFTPSASYTLSSLVLALTNYSGPNHALINLRSDSGGQPGAILQSWTVSGLANTSQQATVSVSSNSNLTLQSGQTYWVEVESSSPDTLDFWSTNSQGLGGGLTSINNGGWIPLGANYGVQSLPAFSVSGIPLSNNGTLGISPASLTFTMTYGGPLPPSQNITLTSSSGTILWGYYGSGSFVSLSPSSNTVSQGSPTTVSVGINSSATGLAAGSYPVYVQVDYGVGYSQVATFLVTLNVVAPTTGTLGISPASLTFNMAYGGPLPPNQNVTFTSSSGMIAWSYSNYVVYVSLPMSGSVTQGSPTTVSVGITYEAISYLAIGSYTYPIQINYGPSYSQVATFYVTLNVGTPTSGTLGVSPSSLSFTSASGQVPPPQNVTITSSSGTLSWGASTQLTSYAPANWISASPTGGVASPGNPGSTTVSISSVVSSFPAGTYTANVNVSSGTQLKTLAVTMNVVPNGLVPTLTVMVFAALVNAPGPPGQTLQVNTLTAGALPFSTQITYQTPPPPPQTQPPYQWLSVSPVTAAPTSLTVYVQPSGLSAGTYVGYVNLAGAPCGTPNSCAISVTLVVEASPDATFAFNYRIGGALPGPQSFALSSASSSVISVLAGAGSDQNNWLSVSPATTVLPAQFTITASPGSLPAGQYKGIVAFTDLLGDTAVELVTLTITAAPAAVIAVAPTSLQFAYTVGGTVPIAQNIQIANTGGGTLSWTASATPTATWIVLSPGSGTAPATLSVSVSPTTLAAGSYAATVLITAAGATGSPAPISVSLVVQAPQPTVNITSVTNGASFQTGFASATWVSIFGTNDSQTSRGWQDTDFVNGLLPTSLSGVSVTINGLPAYVEYISPTQVNILAPDDSTVGAVPIQVTTAQGKSNSFTAQKQQFAPAFFTMGGSYVAAQHADYSYVGKPGLLAGATTQPAKPGETILIYGTGFGPTNPPLLSSRLVTAPAVLANSVQFTIGGVAAPVAYAGLVGAGLYQFNVTVPSVPDGDAAVTAKIGGVQTQTGALVTVQR